MLTMKKTSISQSALVLLATVNLSAQCRAESRVFTSTDGKTLNGEISAATADSLTLKLSSGSQLVVPLQRLGPDDQVFVKNWLKAHPPTINYSFDVTWSKEKTGSSTTGIDHTKNVSNKYVTHIKITNKSGQAIENLDLHYQIYYNDVQGTATILQHRDGKHTIPLIKSGETLTVDTAPISLDSKQLAAGYHYTTGAPSRQIDTLKGIAAIFYHNGKHVFEYVTQGIKKAPEELGETSRSRSNKP